MMFYKHGRQPIQAQASGTVHRCTHGARRGAKLRHSSQMCAWRHGRVPFSLARTHAKEGHAYEPHCFPPHKTARLLFKHAHGKPQHLSLMDRTLLVERAAPPLARLVLFCFVVFTSRAIATTSSTGPGGAASHKARQGTCRACVRVLMQTSCISACWVGHALAHVHPLLDRRGWCGNMIKVGRQPSLTLLQTCHEGHNLRTTTASCCLPWRICRQEAHPHPAPCLRRPARRCWCCRI